MTRDTDTTDASQRDDAGRHAREDDPHDAGRPGGSGGRDLRRRAVLAGAGALAGAGVVGHLARGPATTAAAETVTFDGIEHRALGDASLSTESGSLVASNIDDEGDDGVAAQTVQSTTWQANVDRTTEAMGAGSSLEVQAHVNEEGESGVVGGTTTATMVDDTTAEVTASYSTSSDSGDVTVEAYQDETVVNTYQPADPNDYDAEMVLVDWWDIIFLIRYLSRLSVASGPVTTSDSNDSVTIACVFEYRTGGQLSPVRMGGDTVEANRLRFVETVPDSYDDVWYGTEMQLRGAGMDRITIDSEDVQPGLVFDGHPNRPVGDASLSRTTDVATVSGFDDAGDDGVEIVAGSATSVAANLDAVALDGGASMEAAARGTVDGTDDQSLGTATVRDDGGTPTLSADFGTLGTDTVAVEVYDGTDLVGSDVVAAGDVATLSGDPRLAMAAAVAGSPTGYSKTFDRTTTVRLSSGAAFDGNRVRLLADGPDATVADAETLSLLAAGLDAVDVTAESSSG